MSRSYKKTPIIKLLPSSKHGGAKWFKRDANKKVRKSECQDGGYYKKLYCSYNIHDFILYVDTKWQKTWNKKAYLRK